MRFRNGCIREKSLYLLVGRMSMAFLPMVGRVFSLFGKLFGLPGLDSFGSHFMEQGGDVFLLGYL